MRIGGRGGGGGGVWGERKQFRKLQCGISNRVTDFRDFVCSLFSKAILFFYFYFNNRNKPITDKLI